MPTALITDGDQRAALAIVRSLGHAGYRCIVTEVGPRSLAGSSRFAERQVAVASPTIDPSAYGTQLVRLAKREAVDLLIPVTESSAMAILPVRDQMAAHIPFPAVEVFEAICDKEEVLERAAKLGIGVPAQRQVTNPGDAADLDLTLPIVLKPHRSVVATPGGQRARVGVSWVHERSRLAGALEAYPESAFPILAQEVVSGPGVGIFLLLHEGEVLAQFSHRRIREKPPRGGVSVLRQSEPMDETLLERSVELLRTFGWSGVAMVEYKCDEQTGTPFIMEINGRFWGSLQLAIDAGVDFPCLLAAISLGQEVEPVERYRFVRTRWFWGDVDHLIARWRDPQFTVSDKLKAAADWLAAFGPGYRSEVFRWSDPSPFARETARWVRSAASGSSALRKVRQTSGKL